MVTNPNKERGSRHERDVVAYLRSHGFPYAERAYGAGRPDDCGDIDGIPGFIIECKNHGRDALAQWVDEAEREAANQRKRYGESMIHDGSNAVGVVVHKRRGKPAGAAFVTMTLATFVEIIR